MIYLFYGTDAGKVRAKAFQWVRAARDKAPDAGYVRLGEDELTSERLNDALTAQGLFYTRMLVVLDDPFSNAETSELLFNRLDDLVSSPNPVAIIAPKLALPRVKKLEPVATKVFVFDRVATPGRGFNSGLADALAARNAPLLWKEIVVAQRTGDPPEMIHGLLHWKARQLMTKGGRGWTKDEARSLSIKLIALLSSSRKGDAPLTEQLEYFALSITR